MMETVVRISGIALLGVIGTVLLKERNKGAAAACGACAFFSVMLFCLKGSIGGAVAELVSICRGSGIYEYALVLLRALGIAYIASLTASLCREAGEPVIGGAVELFAKGELIALSLPLVRELMGLAGELVV